MKFPFNPIIWGIILIFTGCAAPSQVMVRPDTWQQADCSAWGFGWLGTPMAIASYHDCVNRFKTLGYIPIEEAESKELPKFEAAADSPLFQCPQPIWPENSEWKYSVNGRINSIRLLKKDVFGGQTVYVVLNSKGKHIYLDESLGTMAILNNGNIEREYTPSLHPFDWPLSVGKSWKATGIMKTTTGRINLATHYEIKGYGKVRVPAGVFDSFYIIGKNDTGRIRIIELWYSPKVQYYVKAIVYTQGGRITEELISYQLGGTDSMQQ